jgi:hypothetical protein
LTTIEIDPRMKIVIMKKSSSGSHPERYGSAV